MSQLAVPQDVPDELGLEGGRNCHALIHAGLLILVGDVKSCEFRAADGRNLHGSGAPSEAFLPQPPPFVQVPDGGPPPLRLNDIPARIDRDWWRRHANLISWSKSGGGYEFRPGRPLSKDEAAAAARCHERDPNESGTVCQPRPARLDDMVGQRRVLASVETSIKAARMTGEPVDHQLLTGPPGLGKTTIARAIAAELGVRLHDTTGSCLRTADDLVQVLMGLDERDVVFIDEIHALGPGVTNIVHRAMEDRQKTRDSHRFFAEQSALRARRHSSAKNR